MKKIILGILTLAIVFSFSYKVSAQTNDVISPIFKIHAYSYNKVSGIYAFEQYGSAVLIANNVLLTNAHVITDENNKLTLQYEACQTISQNEAPVCFSTLQLLRYDKTNDLALLQIINPSENMPTPVVMNSGTLSMGNTVRIVGYPANGGVTITTTQGTIAGFEDGYYKTDANIDEGNSGGGTFNSAGEFVGIPTYVVNGQTTLGYIIPTDVIKEFIGGETGITYKGKYASAFNTWIKSVYAIQDAGVIDNALFTTPDFNELGLSVDNVLEKKPNNLYRYSLYNKNDSMLVISSLIGTDNAAITAYTNDIVKYLKDNAYEANKVSKTLGGIKWNVIGFQDEDVAGYYYIQASSTNKTYLEFVVFVDQEDKDDIPGLIEFIETTTFKRSYTKAAVFNLPTVKLSSKWNVGIVKRLDDDGMSINVFPKNGKYVTEISAYVGAKTDTLKSITSQVKEAYQSVGLKVISETSKYPNSASVMSIIDEESDPMLTVFGVKKYGGDTMFIYIHTELTSSSAKQEAITLSYKILGLQ